MKIRNMNISFFRNASRTGGYCTIYVRIGIGGKRLLIGSTGVRIPVGDWDVSKARVKASHPEAGAHNVRLAQVKMQLQNIWNEKFAAGESVSAEIVKEIYLTRTAPLRLLDGMGKQLAELQARKVASNTISNLRSGRKVVFEYLKARKKIGLLATEMDADRYDDFVEYLRSLGHKPSTVRARAVLLKRSLIWMKKRKLIAYDPLKGVDLPPDSSTTPQPLSAEQVELLDAWRFRSERLRLYADLFLVHCYTGFHYVDLQDLIVAARKGEWQPSEVLGAEWVVWKRRKTGVIAKVPIMPPLRRVLDRVGGWAALPKVSNKTLNDWLKLIAAEVGLPENLCVSMGRDTLTDWLYNKQPATDETVKVILGRKDLRDIARYGSPDERRVMQELGHLIAK